MPKTPVVQELRPIKETDEMKQQMLQEAMKRDRSIAMDQMDLRFLQLRPPTALAVRNMPIP